MWNAGFSSFCQGNVWVENDPCPSLVQLSSASSTWLVVPDSVSTSLDGGEVLHAGTS